MAKNKNDPLGEAAFSNAFNSGGDFHVDLHAGNIVAKPRTAPKPVVPAMPKLAGQGLSPGRESSVKKAAAASVAKRQAAARMKPRKGPKL